MSIHYITPDYLYALFGFISSRQVFICDYYIDGGDQVTEQD